MASPHVDSTLGAGLVGFAVSCVVFGAHTLQLVSYFQRYPLDRLAYKALVASLWLIELVHQIFIGHVIYHYTITNFSSPQVLVVGDVVWSLISQIILGSVIGTVVKALFVMRIWRFSNRNVLVTGALSLLVLGQLGASLAFTIRSYQLRQWIFLKDLTLLASLSLGLSAFTDIVTAVVLVIYLRSLRTGYEQSDSLITHLTIYAINTGAVTSAFSIVTGVLYNVYPSGNFAFIAVYFVLIKLYAISFMCTLNTRRINRGRGTDREHSPATTPGLCSGNFYMVHHGPPKHSHPLSHTKSQLAVGAHQELSVLSDAHH